MGKLRIFLVAPEQPELINIDSEIAAIAEYHEIIPDPHLVGFVTGRDVQHEALKSANRCDVVLFSTHGDVNGILVSNNEYINAEDVSAYIRQLGATLCILNICDSEQLAYRIFYMTKCDVIYCRVKVEDREASMYAGRLAKALYDAETTAEAYSKAGNARGKYELLNVDKALSDKTVSDIAAQIDRLTQAVSRLEASAQEQKQLRDKWEELMHQRETLTQQRIDDLYEKVRGLVDAGRSIAAPSLSSPPPIPNYVVYLVALSLVAFAASIAWLLIQAARS